MSDFGAVYDYALALEASIPAGEAARFEAIRPAVLGMTKRQREEAEKLKTMSPVERLKAEAEIAKKREEDRAKFEEDATKRREQEDAKAQQQAQRDATHAREEAARAEAAPKR